MRSHIVKFVVVGILVLGGVAAVLLPALRENKTAPPPVAAPAPETKPAPVSTGDIPRTEWKAAGFSDPKSAITSALFAGTSGDGEAALASFSPNMKKLVEERFADQLQGRSLAEMIAKRGSQHVSGITAFRILDQQKTSDDEMTVRIFLVGKDRDETYKLRKIDNQWKLDDWPRQ